MGTYVEVPAQTVIGVLETLLAADFVDAEEDVDSVAVVSQLEPARHLVELVRSDEFWDAPDAGPGSAADWWDRVDPRIAEVEQALCGRWGEPRRHTMAVDISHGSALDAVLIAENLDCADVWSIGDRRLVLLSGQGDRELPIILQLIVAPAAYVEDATIDLLADRPLPGGRNPGQGLFQPGTTHC